MNQQTFTQPAPTRRRAALVQALTERRNRKLREAEMLEHVTPCAQLWWVVLLFKDEDETSPAAAIWHIDEKHAEKDATRYRAQGWGVQICAAYAA